MRGNTKHKSDNDYTSEEERTDYPSKKESHHHKRKHKKHKHKIEVLDHGYDKNGNDESPLRSDVIEIHGSSSEDECKNFAKYEYHDRKSYSHRSKHHSKEERRHKKRRKQDASDSDTQTGDREIENRRKKSRGDGVRGENKVLDSDNEDQKSNNHRKRRSRELSLNRSRDDEGHRAGGDVKNRSEARIKVKSRFEVDVEHVKREPIEGEVNRRSRTESTDTRRNNRQGPSGSRDNTRRRGSKDRDGHEWGTSGGNKTNSNKSAGEVQKPNFGLSGKLTEDTNMYNGVVIKYSEPPEARMPKKRWRLYPFKGDEALPPLYIHRQSAYLLGRDRKVVDMPIDHPSCSKQHAALQYRLITYERPNGSVGKQIRLYIIDLESANGTFINNKKIEPKKYVELFEKDVIKFGFSSREYVLLHEHSKDDEPSQDDT